MYLMHVGSLHLQHFYFRSKLQNKIDFMDIGSAASNISVQSRQFLVETKDS